MNGKIVEKIKSIEDKFINSTHKKCTFFIIYTIMFVVVTAIVFSWYFLAGRTFINYHDGWYQHYNALVYYAKYLQSIINTFFETHQLIVPSWDFSIGEGADILETLNYYVIGDPFAVLSVFVPSRFMWLYYGGMVLLRLYLAGISFSCLCFQMGQKSRYAILAGSMTYVFCYYGIRNAAMHPYFLNPMIYFPMIIMGVEKILKKERPYLFICTVFIASLSNFYFFYQIVLLTIIYVVVRIVSVYRRHILDGLWGLFRIGMASILGVLMAAVIFLPVCYVFLSDARMSAGNAYHLFYSLSHYSTLPALFLSSGEPYWVCMGFAAPVLLAVFLMFYKRKENCVVKVFFVIAIVMLLSPVWGQILNGFSYICNRWTWAFALLCAYILTVMWSSLMNLKVKEGKVLLGCTIIYFFVCLLLEYSRTDKVFSAISIVFIFLFLIFPFQIQEKNIWKRKQMLALLLVCISIFCNSFWKNAEVGDDYASLNKELSSVQKEWQGNECYAVMQAAQNYEKVPFYRYSGRDLTYNAGMREGLSSTSYYWTLSNPYVAEFRRTLEMREPSLYFYEGYDDRSALLNLSSVLYYVIPVKDKQPVPYGFTYVDTIDVNKSGTEEIYKTLKRELQMETLSQEQVEIIKASTQSEYVVYRNENALPIGYTYDGYINKDTWNEFSAVEKQEALLQGVVLSEYEGKIGQKKIELTGENIDYIITCNNDGVSYQDGKFVVTSEKASVTLKFKGLKKSETYLSINGLSFQEVPKYDLYFGDNGVDPLNLYNKVNWEILSYKEKELLRKEKLFWKNSGQATISVRSSNGISKKIEYYTKDYSYYQDRHDFTVNLNYSKKAETEIVLSFADVGVYSFDSISVTCQPVETCKQRISKITEEVLEKVKFGTDVITGKIQLDSPKILCLSIPYSEGWEAYVDGEKTNLYRANIMYMALDLNEGKHTIKLVYHTPLLKNGFVVSVIAFFVFVGCVFFTEYQRRKTN